MNAEFKATTGDVEAILERLVSFDTTSHKSNLKLLLYIEQLLAAADIPYRLVPNEAGDKASLFAVIGPEGPGGIGLSGHTDVVPVKGQSWTSDPFQLTARGSRLFGRGTTDMKGFLACMLAAARDFKAAPLRRPIYLIFSYDEEVGCTGVRPLIARLGEDLPMPEMVLVGEPSNCEVVEAHKSIVSFVTKVTGFEAHSSVLHKGASAIEAAARLICFLSQEQARLKQSQNDDRFEPPYSTVHVGKMEGGTARNIVSRSAKFAWEVRALPDFDGMDVLQAMRGYAERELLPAMQAISPDCAIETVIKGEVPGLAAGPEAIRLGLKLANQNASHVVSYGTEGGLFALGGADSVICGPGNISEAHKPDEFIERAELAKCMQVMERVMAQQCAG